jgi:hypothetical protein
LEPRKADDAKARHGRPVPPIGTHCRIRAGTA